MIVPMDDLLRRVARDAGRYRLFAPGEAVVAGISGGPDSLCLLHVLHRLAPQLGLRLHVAHLNHGLRGAEADADAAFVADFAAGLGLPCTIGRAEVARAATEGGLSLEEAGRQARYRFLAGVAASVGAATIAVGHNADDQAETVLMHFLRGSGVAGLRGMLPRTLLADYRIPGAPPTTALDAAGSSCQTVTLSPRPPAPPPLHLVRPLLFVSRGEIEAYCGAHDLRPRFDRSNDDTTFSRNRLRHELLPILETYNPAVREVLTHTAAVLAGEHEMLRRQIEAAWAQIGATVGPDETRFALDAWRALPLGLQRATIREAIQRLRRHLRNINWEHVEAAVWLGREGATGQAATLAAGLELQIGSGSLRIAAEGAAWPPPPDLPQIAAEVALNAPGRTEIGAGWQVNTTRLLRAGLLPAFTKNADPWTAWLDAGVTGETLTLRPRLPGDRFCPQGLGGHSTRLNEFFINVKLPQPARAGWPLLIGRSGIAWVCGLRVDQRAAVGPDTTAVWEVRFERGE